MCIAVTTSYAQSGKELLDDYYSRYMKVVNQGDLSTELIILDKYLSESIIQKDADHEMQARVLKLYLFYNSNLPDSLERYMDSYLDCFEQYEQWGYYYSCRSLRVERLRYNNRMQSALHESIAMYDEAVRQGTDYGKGISAYLIAICYKSLDRSLESIEFFKRAEEYISKENNVGQLHNIYANAWEVYALTGKTEELLALVDRWESAWKDYCRRKDLPLSDVAFYYINCYLARTHAYIDRNDLKAARVALDSALACADEQRDIVQMLLVKEQARYEQAIGNYPKALEYLAESYRLQTNSGNYVGLISTLQRRAEILYKMGRYEESSAIYFDLLPRKDSLQSLDVAAQLDDFSCIYKVDTLNMEKAQLRYWVIIASVVCFVVILLLFIYIYYNRLLHRKNRELVRQIKEREAAQEAVHILREELPYQLISPQEELFVKIQKLLSDNKILTDASLNRDKLADLINTNRNYIADAIRSCTQGMTVSMYISVCRVKYGRYLLENEPLLSIDDIAIKCGFGSRTSFHTAFKEQYNLTPGDFRKAIK